MIVQGPKPVRSVGRRKMASAKRRIAAEIATPKSPPENDLGKSLPCLNPHCKSHGKPHPNCRCYSPGGENFAEGGRVSHFCSSAREHDSSCEYFSEGGEVPTDDLPEELDLHEAVPEEDLPHYLVKDKKQQPEEVPLDDLPEGLGNPASEPGFVEHAKAAAEGVAEGMFGSLAPMAEVGLGISTKEAIKKRAEEHPVAHGVGEGVGFIGSLMTPVGVFGAVGKAASGAAKAAGLGRAGAAILKASLETASFAGSDEMTKAFLGREGSDPEHPVSAALLHVGAAGLMGGLTGGVFSLGEGLIGKGLEALQAPKTIADTEKFLAKLGEKEDPFGLSSKLSKSVAWPIADKTGTGFVGYEIIKSAIEPYVKKITGKANEYVTDAFIGSILTNDISGLPNAIHYATQAAKGLQKTNQALGAIFEAGSAELAPEASDEAVEKLDEFIKGGQVEHQLQNSMGEETPEGFAKGGEVKSEPNDAFAKTFPAQNTLLNAAKGRISSYLNGIRPLANQPKLAFDEPPINTQQKKQYQKALKLAANPMSIFNSINRGTLTPQEMKHFTSMYPEVHRFLSKEMTKKITEAQLEKKKPPYAKRQAMSLFLGADLDSSFSPMAIQKIQSMYAMQKASKQQAVKTKMPSNPKTPNSYLTDEQSREKRMQNQKS